MLTSLVLLSCFLCFYIIKTYGDKKKDLQKEVGYIFENSFKNVETQAMDKMIVELKGISFLPKDSANKKVMVFSKTSSFVKVDSSIMHEDSMSSPKDIQRIVLNSKHIPEIRDTNFDIKIQVNGNEEKIDTTYDRSIFINAIEVEKTFKDKLINSGLSIDYKLTQDSTLRGNKDNPSYEDLFSQKSYYLNIDNNKKVLFKKMLPELLLSLALFLSLLYALYHTINSFRKKQEVYNLKEDFMRNITHELKTPISTIGIALEAAQNFTSEADQAVKEEYYRIAENENQKLNALVDKVLSISQYMDNETGQKELVNLPSLTNEIVESFKLKATQKNISLELISNASQEDLYVNQQILVMCLHNLIDNAIKYIKSEQPRITTKIDESSKEFVIDVMDNGIPIAEEQKSKIFEKFYRIPQGDVHDVKGHGLGLYIVSQLANSLKGNVTLTTDNDGNTFSLSIPKST